MSIGIGIGEKARNQHNEKNLVWTDSLVANFWNYQSNYHPEWYFTRQYGQRIVAVTERFISSAAVVCDFGCGAGFLTEHLAKKFKVVAVDVAPDSVEAAARRMSGSSNFLGAFLSSEAASSLAVLSGGTVCGMVDAVYLVETLEHVLDQHMSSSMSAVSSLLKKNGLIVVTVPNEEDLISSMVYCPCCDHDFHRWQHLRSYSARQIEAHMTQAGFSTIRVFATDFSASTPLQKLKSALRNILGKNPHLVYVGKKL
jgi:2-polyprenyl-3-methyl-5-hydroxy-6-metoxy-1,4-benzoquinol methylase